MSGDTRVPIEFILSMISIIVVLYNVIHSRKREQENQLKAQEERQRIETETQKERQEAELERRIEQAESFVKVNMKLDELCRGNQQIQVLLDRQSEDIKRVTEQVTKNVSDIENLYRNYHDHDERIKILEGRG